MTYNGYGLDTVEILLKESVLWQPVDLLLLKAAYGHQIRLHGCRGNQSDSSRQRQNRAGANYSMGHGKSRSGWKPEHPGGNSHVACWRWHNFTRQRSVVWRPDSAVERHQNIHQ